MAATLQIARPLGHFERLMEAVYFTNQYCGTALSCRYMLPEDLADGSSLHKVQQCFKRAVAQTIQQHPLLQVGLTGEATKDPSFVKLDSINLDDVIQWRAVSSTEDYSAVAQQILEQELETKFVHVATRPGYRMVILVPESSAFLDVLLIFKHTMFDGTSSKIFHRAILDSLNNPSQDASQLRLTNDSILVLQARETKHPPPAESIGRYLFTFDFIIVQIWTQLKSLIWPKGPTATQQYWGPLKPGEGKAERHNIRMDAEQTNKLIQACRARGCTITGLLHGIIFASLLWSTLEVTETHSFISVTAMDMRRFMPSRPITMPESAIDPGKLISNIVSVTEHHFDENTVETLKKLIKPPTKGQGTVHLEEIVWTVAKSTRADLERRLEMGLMNDPMGLLGFVGDWRVERQKAEARPRRETWQVTNLGVLDGTAAPLASGPKANTWRIEHAAFSLSAEAARALFSFAAITAKNGELCLEVTWQSHLGKHIDDIGARLYKDVQEWLGYTANGHWADIKGGHTSLFPSPSDAVM